MSPSLKLIHPSSDRHLVSLDAENSGAGAMDQDLMQICVATLADAHRTGPASGGLLPGNKPKPGGEFTALAESGSIGNCRDDGSGDDRPDPGNLLYAAASGIASAMRSSP
jgi:hypothetical protein